MKAPDPEQQNSASQVSISVMAPDGTVRVVQLGAREVTVGRSPDNDIVLDYANVSLRHARIQFAGMSYRVTDLNSTNGTFVGSVRLLPGVPQPWPADKAVRIGDNWLRLEHGGSVTGSAVRTATAAARAEPPTAEGPRVAAFMEAPDLAVDAGGSVVLTVTVLNQGPVVDHLHVSVLNLPAGWLPGPAPVIRLLPGARQPVSLAITPPRRPESQAGTYPFTIRVASQEAPDEFAEVQARLTVKPYAQFQASLRPQMVHGGKPAQVRVENQGNTPEAYSLSWQDRAEELVFDPAQRQLTVPGGQVGAAEFRAQARRRPLIGGQRSHSFTTEVASPTGEKQALAGEVVSHALMPIWLPLLILAVIVLLIMLLSQGRDRPPIPLPYPVTAIPATWPAKSQLDLTMRGAISTPMPQVTPSAEELQLRGEIDPLGTWVRK